MGYVGRSVPRKEDARLLTGQGLYVADLRLPGMAEVAFLRSPYAHARIRSIDVSEALRQPGVIAAIAAADLGLEPRRLPHLMPHQSLRPVLPYPLAHEEVHYVGQPVVAVVAENRYQAEDALEYIDVEYEDLPVVSDPEAALAEGSALCHSDGPDNLAAQMTQTVGDPDAAFADADLTFHLDFKFGRLSGQPMETRGVVAQSLRSKLGRSLTVWSSTQTPHGARRILSALLDLPQRSIRVVAPDVGGGFGVKMYLYPEEVVVALLAERVGRPVRWIEDRRENLLATYQAREQVHHVDVAAKRDGTLLAIRDRYVVDMGAYSVWGIVVPFNAGTTLPGPYHVRNCQIEMQAAYTNRVPIAPYRSAGRPQAVYAIERTMDQIAQRLGLDPFEVRRRNLVQPHEFPHRLGLRDRDGTEIAYDSGDYPATLDACLKAIDLPRFREEQAAAREEGRYLGLGIACYVEPGGRGPFEGATVRVDPSGSVTVVTGSTPQGQAHETILAQLCADRLGVDIDDVSVLTGDTEAIAMGIGTFASRSAVTAGNAVSAAAISVREKALTVAGRLLRVDPEDLELADGVIRVRGLPDQQFTLGEIARTVSSPPPAFTFPEGLEPGLEETHYFHPEANTYSNGVHAAIVEVDLETGVVAVKRYVVSHDCGRVINPAVVDGQVRGGVAQGIGNALYEEIVFDEEGQPKTTSYRDYLVPTAVEVPNVEVHHLETLSTRNPEGIKGTGEGGSMAAPAAVANAINDALAPLGITLDGIPMTPDRVRAAIRQVTVP
jgi:aerobic carbon-monoxide dehydrogenase large subunit